MKAFEYAAPRRERDLVSLLSTEPGKTAVLAGGTDLVGLMKKMIVTPDRVVNIKEVDSMRGISADSEQVVIGAVTTLDDVLEAPELAEFPAIRQAIAGISSLQLQSQGTLGGELLQRPRCWYFRNGFGLSADRGRLVAEGDNRFHAIFDNAGPAKFVSASRLAPALVALGAKVRVIGPAAESWLPLEAIYRTPRGSAESEFSLAADQVVSHIAVPKTQLPACATYEVRHGEGPDYPLAAAAVALWRENGVVVDANIVLGQVAPTPWISREASERLLGKTINGDTALAAGEAAVRAATPLSHNAYKVQLARVAVQRAILAAAGLDHGGF